MTHPKNIFFETYSFLQVLSLSWRIHSAKQIIFCRPGLLRQSSRWKKRLVRGFIRLLNPRAMVQEVSIDITEEIWKLIAETQHADTKFPLNEKIFSIKQELSS